MSTVIYEIPGTEKGAILSGCERYRYLLWRRWEPRASMKPLLFAMLNPSTADATEDDPTIRRCMGFARAWGFPGVLVVNAFAWRATDPRELEDAEDPIGPLNDTYLRSAAHEAGRVIVGWGSHKLLQKNRSEAARARVYAVAEALGHDRLEALKINKDGSPAHPLYIPNATQPVPWSPL